LSPRWATTCNSLTTKFITYKLLNAGQIIRKLLRRNVSLPQIIGFAIANAVGLTIVMAAVQFYRDVQPVFADSESFISKDYLIITRQVSGAGAMLGEKGEFDDAAIAEIEAQPWCRKVGRFTSSRFAVNAAVGVGGGHGMSSQFFFESIPDEFMDTGADQWQFDPAHPEVPVIIPRDYLSLYNFGFATTQGMPQISESQAGKMPLTFTLSGNGRQMTLSGKLVGFSSRLNTVMVPQAFMQWANEQFAGGEKALPMRLIIEVNRPGDIAIEQFMNDHAYQVAGDKLASSKANRFLTVIIGIVIGIGVIISLLAFFVMMLSIYLLLQKNTRRLQDLLLLGYSPSAVAKPYVAMVLLVGVAVLVVATLLMLLLRSLWLPMLEGFGVTPAPVWTAILVGIVIMALITIGNIAAIKRKIAPLWHQN